MYSVVILNLTTMKKLVFILFLLNLSSGVMAQDHWKLYCGKKILFQTDKTDDTTVVIRLGEKVLNSGQDLRLTYQEEMARKDWNRHFSITDSQGAELKNFEGPGTMRIPFTELGKMLESNPALKIFTWAIPNDPEMAARVRVRRVYLCSLAKE